MPQSPVFPYYNAPAEAFEGNVNVGGSTAVALLDSSYTPNPSSQVHFSDVSGHEISGTGYTAGGAGVTLSTATTIANSFTQTWASSTSFAYGQVVRPTSGNGFLYEVAAAGFTGSSEPTWPTTIGRSVTDAGVIWTCVATAAYIVSSTPVSWVSATFDTSFAVLYDDVSGVLICYQDFGGSQDPASQTFTVTPDPILGWIWIPIG